MNAITSGTLEQACMSSMRSTSLGMLNRAALSNGAADRRTQLHEIEASIDCACEAAVRRLLPHHAADRTIWNRRIWSVYVQEAVAQATRHAATVARLRREAQHLDHLAADVS